VWLDRFYREEDAITTAGARSVEYSILAIQTFLLFLLPADLLLVRYASLRLLNMDSIEGEKEEMKEETHDVEDTEQDELDEFDEEEELEEEEEQ
jgi:hypothetical protein